MIEHISIFTKNLRRNQKLRREKKEEKKKMKFCDKKEANKAEKYINIFGLDSYSDYYLPKAYTSNANSFFSYSGLVFFYPPNDGTAKLPIHFYKDHDLVLKNSNAYSEIENLDEILLKMVDIFDKAIDQKISINPYGFMLELTDDLKKDYKGKANLVITDMSLGNNNKETRKYFVNRFLDHFMGWNFGVSINRNEKLKEALIRLNNKVIEKKLREDAGLGYGVYGTEKDIYNGLQHYYLPTSKENVKKKIK